MPLRFGTFWLYILCGNIHPQHLNSGQSRVLALLPMKPLCGAIYGELAILPMKPLCGAIWGTGTFAHETIVWGHTMGNWHLPKQCLEPRV